MTIEVKPFKITPKNKKKFRDKLWRLNNLYYVVNKDKKRVKFKLNKAQDHYFHHATMRNIILKSRQLGFTTYECIDMLDDTLFNRNFLALFVAHTDKDAQIIFDNKVSFAWNNISPEIAEMWKVDADSANQLKFDFLNNTYSSILVANSGRSGTYSRVHVSELGKLCAKFPLKAAELISGTLPAVPITGRIDIESTAEGMGNEFYDMFKDAWDRDRTAMSFEYTAFFYNWTWDEEEISKIEKIIPVSEMEESAKFAKYQKLHNLTDIQITYYYVKWISVAKDWDTLHQEYPTTAEEAFIASGRPVFDMDICNKNFKAYEKFKPERFDLEFIRENGRIVGVKKELNEQGFFSQFVTRLEIDPVKDKNRFAIGFDVAEGLLQGDFSAGEVLDRTNMTFPIKWHGHIDPDLLAWEQLKLQIYLKGCCVTGTELNNHGRSTVPTARDIGVTQYRRQKYEKGYEEVTSAFGFLTTSVTRPIILGFVKEGIRSEGFEDKDKGFWKETLTFTKDEHGKEQAEGKGKNPGTKNFDDRVLAKGICFAVHEAMPPLTSRFEELKERLKREYQNKRKRSLV